jgi:periplasmic copper chaperone A
MFRTSLFGAAFVLASFSTGFAHITLQEQQAAVGGSYKAVFRVPHGCNGSATVAVKVRIPDGFIDVKPMPKAGWKLDVSRGQYAKPINAHGAKVTEGVNEVDWSGGNLPDAYYDEFVLTGYIGDEAPAGQTIYFPVVQECEKGVNRWIEIPAAGGHDHGHDAHDEAGEPAAALRLLPKR